jgi:uncharacterized protein YjbI with pentapeptide repeats
VLGKDPWVRTAGVPIDLHEADLQMASLWSMDFSGAILFGADLRGTDFSYSSLANASLRGCRMERAMLRDTRLVGADLSGARLTNAKGLTQAQLDSATTDQWTLVSPPLKVGGKAAIR